MSPLYARESALIPIIATVTLAGFEGYGYKLDGSNQAVAITAITDVPAGIILAVSTNGLEITAAPLGANHGTVRLKLGTDVTDLRKALTVKADGTFESDDGAGARVLVAIPLETGTATEEIEAVLLPPRAVPANAGISTIIVPMILAGITAADVLSLFLPGYAFELLAFDFYVTKPATTAAKAATLGLKIDVTAVTGGAIGLTSADCTPLGVKVAGTAITAANIGTANDTITIAASAVTAFVEGEGFAAIKLRNLDTFHALGGTTV